MSDSAWPTYRIGQTAQATVEVRADGGSDVLLFGSEIAASDLMIIMSGGDSRKGRNLAIAKIKGQPAGGEATDFSLRRIARKAEEMTGRSIYAGAITKQNDDTQWLIDAKVLLRRVTYLTNRSQHYPSATRNLCNVSDKPLHIRQRREQILDFRTRGAPSISF